MDDDDSSGSDVDGGNTPPRQTIATAFEESDDDDGEDDALLASALSNQTTSKSDSADDENPNKRKKTTDTPSTESSPTGDQAKKGGDDDGNDAPDSEDEDDYESARAMAGRIKARHAHKQAFKEEQEQLNASLAKATSATNGTMQKHRRYLKARKQRTENFQFLEEVTNAGGAIRFAEARAQHAELSTEQKNIIEQYKVVDFPSYFPGVYAARVDREKKLDVSFPQLPPRRIPNNWVVSMLEKDFSLEEVPLSAAQAAKLQSDFQPFPIALGSSLSSQTSKVRFKHYDKPHHELQQSYTLTPTAMPLHTVPDSIRILLEGNVLSAAFSPSESTLFHNELGNFLVELCAVVAPPLSQSIARSVTDIMIKWDKWAHARQVSQQPQSQCADGTSNCETDRADGGDGDGNDDDGNDDDDDDDDDDEPLEHRVPWKPSYALLKRVLMHFGIAVTSADIISARAKAYVAGERGLDEEQKEKEKRKEGEPGHETDTAKQSTATDNSRPAIRQFLPFFQVEPVLRIFAASLATFTPHRDFSTPETLMEIVHVLCLLVMDWRCMGHLAALSQALAATLEQLNITEHHDLLTDLCVYLLETNHHHNVVFLIQQLPPTTQSERFKHLLAANFVLFHVEPVVAAARLNKRSKKKRKKQATSKNNEKAARTEAAARYSFCPLAADATIENRLGVLARAISVIAIDSAVDLDFYRLMSLILALDTCVPNTRSVVTAKKQLEQIRRHLEQWKRHAPPNPNKMDITRFGTEVLRVQSKIDASLTEIALRNMNGHQTRFEALQSTRANATDQDDEGDGDGDGDGETEAKTEQEANPQPVPNSLAEVKTE